jgi:hypothetical protein
MRKKALSILCFAVTLLMIGCSSSIKRGLDGFYQSEVVNGYHVQMTFNKADNSFIEYIDNREVNKGSYENLKDNTYKVNGDTQSFEIILGEDNSFEITINKLNDGNPIKMKNIAGDPTYVRTGFDDVEEYKKLLD